VKPFWISTFLLLALVPSPAAIPAAVGPRALHRYEASRMSMASAYAIVAYGEDASALPRILEAAFDEVDRIDRLMSHYKPESPLSRLNREAAAGSVAVEAELFDFLTECLRYARESDGAFDITVGPLMKTWGFFRGGGRLPSDAEIEDVRARVGYAHVILDAKARTVRFDRPGVELDLGGIAKGYAVDRVVALLRREGVAAALVSAGGSTIYGLGAPPGHGAWEVTVQDPLGGEGTALTVRLRDRALSVSGSSEKSFERDGVRYSHIMDPRRGRPVQGVLSVAVLAPTGTAGDALDNAFFVQGVQDSGTYLRCLPETEVIFFLPREGNRWKMVRLQGPHGKASHRGAAPPRTHSPCSPT
jgi:thiamine biosynthesis lipoprotein